MNLIIGYKERVDGQWIYTLKDGTTLTRKQWTKCVENHIKENHKQEVFNRIRERLGSERWVDEETPHDFALQNYAAVYCANVKVSDEGKAS